MLNWTAPFNHDLIVFIFHQSGLLLLHSGSITQGVIEIAQYCSSIDLFIAHSISQSSLTYQMSLAGAGSHMNSVIAFRFQGCLAFSAPPFAFAVPVRCPLWVGLGLFSHHEIDFACFPAPNTPICLTNSAGENCQRLLRCLLPAVRRKPPQKTLILKSKRFCFCAAPGDDFWYRFAKLCI